MLNSNPSNPPLVGYLTGNRFMDRDTPNIESIRQTAFLFSLSPLGLVFKYSIRQTRDGSDGGV